MLRNTDIKRLGQQHYNEVYDQELSKGMACLPQDNRFGAAADTLHRKARMEADRARIQYELELSICPDMHLQSKASASAVPALDHPMFQVPTLPPLANIFQDVVLGENYRAFSMLERVTNAMRQNGTTRPLLLVGPPSCGKTMTSQIVARALDRPFLPLSAGTLEGDLFDLVEGQISKLHEGMPFSEIYKHPDNPMPVYRVKPTVIFVDEAHLLPPKLQTLLLQTTEKPYRLSKADGTYMDFQDVLVILGTTDPTLKSGGGGLVKPLCTRCANGGIYFVPYSAESVAEMVRRAYPQVSQEDAVLAAKAAKLYPRVALGYVADAGPLNLGHYLQHELGVNDLGLDPDDLKLLDILESATVYKDPEKVRICEDTIAAAEAGHHVSAQQLIRARAFLDTIKPKPMSIQALAAEMMATDEEGIKARIHYMQSLKLVARTPRGVVRIK